MQSSISLQEYRSLLAASPGKISPVKKRRQSVEEALHRACIEWAMLNRARYPALSWLIHVPNGGRRPRGEAGKLKALGVKKGVPDLLLPLPSPNGRWLGLAAELKSPSSRLSEEQATWLKKLSANGWLTGTVRSLDEFVTMINIFMKETLETQT